ncbi:hypothetical protein [Bacillus wiedmannii]|nr:hypothetical protein [Bacillus wiedmannii]
MNVKVVDIAKVNLYKKAVQLRATFFIFAHKIILNRQIDASRHLFVFK